MTPRKAIARLVDEGREAIAALPTCCPGDGITYLVAGADLVKIGCTTNLPQRLASLQTGSPVPLRIVALARGADFEQTLHIRFAEHRRHGEWFALEPVLANLRIAQARTRALRECLRCSLTLGPRTSFRRAQHVALAAFAAGALAAGCGGCAHEYAPWTDVPTATITPHAPPEFAAEWTAIVAYDAKRWNDGLALVSCPPAFAIGEAGHSVALVPRARWEYSGLNAWTDADEIAVEVGRDGTAPADGAVMHELGHAIGLGHADPARGPSVMLPESPSYFYRRDVDAAACVLGCGPCDPAADPYDRR